MDIKRGCVFPVTQGVRTLAAEYLSPGDLDRGADQSAGGGGSVLGGLAAGLREAYEFFQTLRVRSQAERIGAGEKPDNYISPDSLSSMERDRLKECFKVVIDFQSLIFNKYGLRLLI
jgi:CBS domain-containing protein